MTKKSKNKFQTDIKQYFNDIEKNKTLVAVLKGHLIIEKALNDLIECGLKYPDRALIHSLRYGQKIDLLVSLGLLKAESKPAFNKLNSIRNQIAHEFDKKINEKDVINFFNFLTEEQILGLEYQNVKNILRVFSVEAALYDMVCTLLFEIHWELSKYSKSIFYG